MIQTLLLGYVLTLAGLLIHEGLHLVVLNLLGHQGVMLVVPWRLVINDYHIYGLHVQPTTPLDVFDQALFDFLGPALAALPFLILALYVKEKIPRAALIANVFVQIFFAILETCYEFLESTLKIKIGILGSPEFNIGAVLIILLFVAYKQIWKR
jgi:hypothetical protein